MGYQHSKNKHAPKITNTALSIFSELSKLESDPEVDRNLLVKFHMRLKRKNILRSSGTPDHFCVFFLPVDRDSNMIFLGNHIKANDWIPPGGHIEQNESPLETIRREMKEELKYKLDKEVIELFSLTIKSIKKKDCQKHWDLWYVIYMPKIDFIFDKSEYYNVKWVTWNEAKYLTKNRDYNAVIQKLRSLLK